MKRPDYIEKDDLLAMPREVDNHLDKIINTLSLIPEKDAAEIWSAFVDAECQVRWEYREIVSKALGRIGIVVTARRQELHEAASRELKELQDGNEEQAG